MHPSSFAQLHLPIISYLTTMPSFFVHPDIAKAHNNGISLRQYVRYSVTREKGNHHFHQLLAVF
jgi:hypothetical protein